MLKKREDLSKVASEVVAEIELPVEKKIDYDYSNVISTGSTLLDLSISGNKGVGGIPGGLIVEIYGEPGSGKTAILSEVGASAQSRGGEVMFLDPEARLDQEYSRIYGIQLNHKDYHRPDTVTEMFNYIHTWEPSNQNVVNVIATDSLAALSTELEMEKEDKMGMRRAKEFSEGLRKTARKIANNKWLIACSNQVREGQYGETTPGGMAIPFYSSLRIRVNRIRNIDVERDINGKKVKKTIGIESSCFIKKSTVDDPYRECKVYIIFNYGIDDIRGNLQYLKDMTRNTVYDCLDGKTYLSLEKAIVHVETNKLVDKLKEATIAMWRDVESRFKTNRVTKIR